MPTALAWYPRPPIDTGLGLHDSVFTANLPHNGNDTAMRAWAQALRASGISWYKILADGTNKVRMCQILIEEGIMPIVRLYKLRPHPTYVPPAGLVGAYVAVGARYFETGNEPNINGDEWENGVIPPPDQLGTLIADQWLLSAARVKSEGGIPLVYAMTPEGIYSGAGGHRRFTRDFIRRVKARGQSGLFEQSAVALHPRPHNNPPFTPATDHNTVTFNEWEVYQTIYEDELGWCPPLLATEHGYSLDDHQNTDFPPITDMTWASFNRVLFERMNPTHPQTVPPILFCLCYWLERDGGIWAKDEITKSIWPADLTTWGQTFQNMNVSWHRSLQSQPQPPSFTFDAWLKTEGAKIATVPVTPGFRLYDAILAHGFIPNGDEVTKAAQGGSLPSGIQAGDAVTFRHAEHPRTGEKRIYYVKVPAPGQPWGNARFVVRQAGRT